MNNECLFFLITHHWDLSKVTPWLVIERRSAMIDKNTESLIVQLIVACRQIAGGEYETARNLFELTKTGSYPAIITELAESFGMMIVKTEAREYRLEELVEQLKQSFEKLQETLKGTIFALSSAIEMRDPYTAGHQLRTATLASAIAAEMGLDEDRIEGIRVGGVLHDIGKIYVPAEILCKPTTLTDIELSLIKTHAQMGYDILKNVEFPWPVARIALQHHERLDGSGYPQGLSGDVIIPEAKIMAVADVIETMSSHRPYRPALGMEKALLEIVNHKGTFFNPGAVEACERLIREKQFSSA